jgi:hypothetical protein
VRTALYYAAGAWVLAQATDLLLDAFEASHYMRFVIAGLVLGLPVVTVLAWMFDLTRAASSAPGTGCGPRLRRRLFLHRSVRLPCCRSQT